MSPASRDHVPALPLVAATRAELLVALVRGECLSAVVPMVLDVVELTPLASAGCFPGDLLRGLMEVPGRFWSRYPRWYDRYRDALRAGAALRRRLPPEQRMEFWSVLDVARLERSAPPNE